MLMLVLMLALVLVLALVLALVLLLALVLVPGNRVRSPLLHRSVRVNLKSVQ